MKGRNIWTFKCLFLAISQFLTWTKKRLSMKEGLFAQSLWGVGELHRRCAPQSGEHPAVVACHCQVLWASSSSWALGFFTCQELMNRLLTQTVRFKQPLGEIQIVSSWACSSNTTQTSWGTAESRLCSSMYQTHYTWSRLFYPLSTLCLNKQFWHRDRFLLWTLDSAWYDDTLISD